MKTTISSCPMQIRKQNGASVEVHRRRCPAGVFPETSLLIHPLERKPPGVDLQLRKIAN